MVNETLRIQMRKEIKRSDIEEFCFRKSATCDLLFPLTISARHPPTVRVKIHLELLFRDPLSQKISDAP